MCNFVRITSKKAEKAPRGCWNGEENKMLGIL